MADKKLDDMSTSVEGKVQKIAPEAMDVSEEPKDLSEPFGKPALLAEPRSNEVQTDVVLEGERTEEVAVEKQADDSEKAGNAHAGKAPLGEAAATVGESENGGTGAALLVIGALALGLYLLSQQQKRSPAA